MSGTAESVRKAIRKFHAEGTQAYHSEITNLLKRYASLLEQSAFEKEILETLSEGILYRDAEIAALKARVEELEKQLTVTDDRDRTHSAECWKWHRHHACAIRRVEELDTSLEKSVKWAAQLYDELQAEFAKARLSAGVWVPVGERMPDWHDQVVVIDSEHVLHMSALQTGAGEREPYWIDEDMMDEVTHWLDENLPGEQRVDQGE